MTSLMECLESPGFVGFEHLIVRRHAIRVSMMRSLHALLVHILGVPLAQGLISNRSVSRALAWSPTDGFVTFGHSLLARDRCSMRGKSFRWVGYISSSALCSGGRRLIHTRPNRRGHSAPW